MNKLYDILKLVIVGYDEERWQVRYLRYATKEQNEEDVCFWIPKRNKENE